MPDWVADRPEWQGDDPQVDADLPTGDDRYSAAQAPDFGQGA